MSAASSQLGGRARKGDLEPVIQAGADSLKSRSLSPTPRRRSRLRVLALSQDRRPRCTDLQQALAVAR
jgi:hypothetical protein